MKIVILDGSTLNPGDNPWTGLEQLGELIVHERTAAEELHQRCEGAEVLVTNKVPLKRELIEQLPQLKFITVTATGFDCVDIEAARERQIPVANVPVYGTDSVAQHIFALLLHILHRVDVHHEAVQVGEWAERGNFSFWKVPLSELSGKTLGIIGFGRIGREVGNLGHAFGMRILAHSRRRNDAPNYSPFEWVDLGDLVEQSDVISLNCPLTPETDGLVNRDFLSRCKESAILINASRGALVVEADLAEALTSKHLAAAGLDVVSSEPIQSDNPLLGIDNCFITPHLAWATLEARKRLMQVTVDNVEAFLGGAPQNVVN